MLDEKEARGGNFQKIFGSKNFFWVSKFWVKYDQHVFITVISEIWVKNFGLQFELI